MYFAAFSIPTFPARTMTSAMLAPDSFAIGRAAPKYAARDRPALVDRQGHRQSCRGLRARLFAAAGGLSQPLQVKGHLRVLGRRARAPSSCAPACPWPCARPVFLKYRRGFCPRISAFAAGKNLLLGKSGRNFVVDYGGRIIWRCLWPKPPGFMNQRAVQMAEFRHPLSNKVARRILIMALLHGGIDPHRVNARLTRLHLTL